MLIIRNFTDLNGTCDWNYRDKTAGNYCLPQKLSGVPG